MRRINFLVVLSAIVIFFSVSLAAHAKFQLSERRGGEGNFLFERDPSSLVTTVMVVVMAGSAHDPKGKEGLASFAFDSITRGTKTKSRDAFANAVEGLGATIGANANYVRSVISLDVISENFAPGVQLLGEALSASALSGAEFDRLKSERLALLDQARSNPTRVLFRAARAQLYRGTTLAHYPDGSIESVKKISLADLRAFIGRHFHNGNFLVAVNSNLDKELVRAAIEKAFANVALGAPTPLPELKAPKISGRHLIILERKGLTTVPALIAHPTVGSTYPRLAELEIGDFILGGSMSSRLFNVLRNENGWTYGAQSSFQIFDKPRKHGGVFSIYTFPATEHAMVAIPKAVEIYTNFEDKGLSSAELGFAKNSLINSYAFNFVSASDRLNGRLMEILEGLPFESVDSYRARMNAVNANDLQRWIQEAHDSTNFILGVAGDPTFLRELVMKIPGIQSVKVVKDPVAKIE
jgi:zinc protease